MRWQDVRHKGFDVFLVAEREHQISLIQDQELQRVFQSGDVVVVHVVQTSGPVCR